MNPTESTPLVIRGWTIFAHPLFLCQVEALAERVSARKTIDPTGYRSKNDTKRLAAIVRLAFEVIPEDPARADFRQGNTLGVEDKHWFRATFFQQYRLFFRFHAASRMIVLAWVNDDATRRAYESADDAFRVFRRMLDTGHPPSDWQHLLAEARAEEHRLKRLVDETGL